MWCENADLAFPCATQNELSGSDAEALVANGVICVSEGANMPCTRDAVPVFLKSGISYGPGKDANAGGVAVSQLEMQQNAAMASWSAERVDTALRTCLLYTSPSPRD